MIYTVDADALKSAFISGANNLCNNKEILNDLNVFPVPDGDTGSNMSMTVMAAVRELSEKEFSSAGEVMSCVSGAALRGARGNSGVILSQLFRGMAKGLKGIKTAEATDIANGFKEGVNAAYRAVMKPQEGTILSVSRDGADKALEEASNTNDILAVLKATVEEAQKSLDNTPNLLPQLKQAGVVDAGGQGILYMLSGALIFIETGKIVELKDAAGVTPVKQSAASTANTDIKFAYCTEFLINKKYAKDDSNGFVDSIKTKGDSMVVIDDDTDTACDDTDCACAFDAVIRIGGELFGKLRFTSEQFLFRHERQAREDAPTAVFGEAPFLCRRNAASSPPLEVR